MKKIIFTIILLSLFTGSILAEEWETTPVNEQYYKDKFKKPYFHLGIGGAVGGAWYPAVKGYDNFPKYILSFRLAPEIKNYRLGFIMKFQQLIEYKMLTDDSSYYEERFKMEIVIMSGVFMRLPSPVSIFISLKPYFLVGGGYIVEENYSSMFVDDDDNLYDSEIYGSGPVLGFNLGTELELMENLLSLDIGMNFLYGFDIRQEMYSGDDKDEVGDRLDEMEFAYHIGFIFNLF